MLREDQQISEGSARPSVAAIRAALQAILGSSGFQKSERQSKFLRFVCEAALNGESDNLNEILIAQTVFDRGSDYSPGEDSVVRRQAYSVRQKLQDYYANEGSTDPVRIGLPVGHYVPIFSFASELPVATRPEPAAQPALPLPEEPLSKEISGVSSVTRPIPKLWFLLAGMGGLICFALGWGLSPSAIKPASADPGLAGVWGDWLTKPQETLFCFSNPLLAQIRVSEPFSNDILPGWIEFTEPQGRTLRKMLSLPPGGHMYLTPEPNTGAKMGEALGSIRLAAFLTRFGVSVRGTQSRLLNWDDFRSRSLILLGHTEANRWLEPILNGLPLRVGPWQPSRPTRVINMYPKKGEPAEYDAEPTVSLNRLRAYALVSMVAGVDGRHELLLINGLSTEGTQIAEDFLTDPVSASQLITALRTVAPQHTGPWHFQMLLRADVHENVPTRADLVAVRVL